MSNFKIYFILLSFLFTAKAYSQNIPNGYYNNTENKTYLYVHNDTIILPSFSGTIGITILKGVIDKKRKWIDFIPVKDKMESSYNIVEQKKSDRISILRFNLYSYFTRTLLSDWYDGSSVANGTYLRCALVYTTPENRLVKKDTSLIFNGKYFEIGLSNDLFISAELTVRSGGKYITVPILRDTFLFVDVIQSPPVFYDDKEKRMKFKYSEEDQRIEILFNFPFNNHWNRFVKAEEPLGIGSHKFAMYKHINDLILPPTGIYGKFDSKLIDTIVDVEGKEILIRVYEKAPGLVNLDIQVYLRPSDIVGWKLLCTYHTCTTEVDWELNQERRELIFKSESDKVLITLPFDILVTTCFP